MGLILGGVSARDLVMDGQSVSLYAGGSPPVKVWPTAVQITLGTNLEAQAQLRAALSDRGLNYRTVTEIPFDIELVGTGSARLMFFDCSALTHAPAMDTSNVTSMDQMFYNCAALTAVPDMDTSQVTNMNQMFYECAALSSVPAMDTSSVTNMSYMFRGCPALTSVSEMDTSSVTNMTQMFYNCSSLTHVPDMDTSQVTNTRYMFYYCAALTDGNVRLIGKHPQVDTTGMIGGSGLTREPFYTTDGQPWPTAEVHEVSVSGTGTRPLVTVTVPAGETWAVTIEGTVTQASAAGSSQPTFRIGSSVSGRYGQGATVSFAGTVTSSASTIAMEAAAFASAAFVGTVTIEK